ncbi:hypothetical protein BSKO_03507 [Bryopsis sp. KO-2023]|nr:hypothetical protein BSKO_03507 [Bryopsis sp. KO-2023]
MQTIPLSQPGVHFRSPKKTRVASLTGPRCVREKPADRPQLRRPLGCKRGARPVSTQVLGGLEAPLGGFLAQNPGLTYGVAANTAVFLLGIRVLLSGLTWTGVFHSWLLGCSIYSAFGLGGYFLVCLYFIFGSLVTKVKLEQKKKEGIAEARSGRRSLGSVWGSGIAGVFCAVMGLISGNFSFWQVGFVASFGSKLSDTVSSEIGKAYGKTTYLVTTFERCPRGTEGAVSLEGTLAGFGAALCYGLLAYAIGQVTLQGALIVFGACVAANLFESYLGASMQGQIPWLTNDVVNMLQISVAAALAISARSLLP